MKTFYLMCTGSTGAPALEHEFDMPSERLAIEYATRQIPMIASHRYYNFDLHTEDGMVAQFTAKSEMKVQRAG